MSENMTETEIDIGAFGETEIVEYFSHPIWKHVHHALQEQRKVLMDDLLRGDIEVRMRNELGRKFRSNESVRGALLMVDFLITIPALVDEDAEAARLMKEQKQNNEKGD